MLRRRAETAQKQRCHQPPKIIAGSSEAIAQAAQARAQRQHGAATDPLGNVRGRDLQTRHGAAVDHAQQADGGIAQAELSLPDRQGHPDQIRIAVVQGVRAASDAERTPFPALGGCLISGIDRSGGRHAFLAENCASHPGFQAAVR
jgi:hypothetical protein